MENVVGQSFWKIRKSICGKVVSGFGSRGQRVRVSGSQCPLISGPGIQATDGSAFSNSEWPSSPIRLGPGINTITTKGGWISPRSVTTQAPREGCRYANCACRGLNMNSGLQSIVHSPLILPGLQIGFSTITSHSLFYLDHDDMLEIPRSRGRTRLTHKLKVVIQVMIGV